MASAVDRVERELTLLVRQAQRVRLPAERGQHVLERTAYVTMCWLSDHGPARATDLAESIGLSCPAMSRLLHALHDDRLVKRSFDPRDGRAQLVELTEQGRNALNTTRQQRRQLFRSLLATWEPGEVASLADLLGRLNQGVAEVTRIGVPRTTSGRRAGELSNRVLSGDKLSNPS